MAQLTPGGQLGPYQLLEKVGRGGMAEVWKAFQPSLSRTVAIKVLPEFLAEDESFRERFKAEATTVARLRHPNVLSVFDYGEHEGIAYIVSEFIDGGTLSTRLGSPLPLDEVVRLLVPIASALDHAHAQGIVHRDLKPSNVLLTADGNPVLSDFGLARMLDSGSRLTRTGTAVGTPQYMSPEQAAGDDAGPASDRYSLAVMAYEMLTGTVPFNADTPLATLLAHLHKPLPLPREKNPALSDATERVLLKGLAKRPEDRYGAASDMISALGGGTASAPAVTAAIASPGPAASPSPMRVPKVALAGAAGAVLLAGALAFTALARNSAPVASPTAAPAEPSAPAAVPSSPAATASARATALPVRPSGNAAGPQSNWPAPAVEGLGREVWVARMEARELSQSHAEPEGKAEVRATGAALEFSLRSQDSRAYAMFRRPVPNEYIAQAELEFAEDVPFVLMSLRGDQREQVMLVIEPRGQIYIATMRSDAHGGPKPLSDSKRIPLPYQRRAEVVVAVGEHDYTVHVDGKEVLAYTDELEGERGPLVGFAAGGGQGGYRVNKLRIFELDR